MIPSHFVASEGIVPEAQRNLMLQEMMGHERLSVHVSSFVIYVFCDLEMENKQ